MAYQTYKKVTAHDIVSRFHLIAKPNESYFSIFVIAKSKCKRYMTNEQPKMFSEELINNNIKLLPDAKTYEFDEIERQVYETDFNSETRPVYATVVYLVFGKNETKDSWELRGYHY